MTICNQNVTYVFLLIAVWPWLNLISNKYFKLNALNKQPFDTFVPDIQLRNKQLTLH